MPARILIADDNPAVRRALRSLLSQQEGWEICGEAENGRAAVEMARKLSPDAIILDVSMPGLNGLEAAREIRNIFPSVPIFVFTLHASPELQTAAHEAGVNGILSKGSDPSHLLNAIKSAMGF